MKKNDLNKQEYMDFLQSCKYAIVAMQNETHEALHVVLYAEFPREIDFNNLAEELKTRYSDRLVIYDMPPVLNQDDPIAFLPNIDAFILVVRNGVTLTSDVKNALNLLSGANVIGTVLNNYDKSAEF